MEFLGCSRKCFSHMSEPPAIIDVTLRRRVWRVTLDGVFYGDYRSERHAADSVQAAAAALRKSGRLVHITTALGK